MTPTIVTQLKHYRKSNNLTYAELAKLLATTTDIVWDLLNNRRQYIDLKTLQRAQDLLANSIQEEV